MNGGTVERMANVIDRVTGGRVESGTATPLWVRFSVQMSADVPDLAGVLAEALGEPVRIDRRGAAVDVIVTRRNPEPVRLRPLMRGLGEQIPPLTATLGLADDGSPLLARLAGDVVGNIVAPAELLPTLAASLALRKNGERLLAGGREVAAGLRRLIDYRRNGGEADPAVVAFLASTDGLDAAMLQRGPAVHVHVVAAGRADGLPFGLQIERNGTGMVARCSAGEVIRFTPATVEGGGPALLEGGPK